MKVFQQLSQLVRPGDSLRISIERTDAHIDIRIVPALKGVDADDADPIRRQLAAVLAKPVSIRVPHALDADAAVADYLASGEADARSGAALADTEYAEAVRDASNAAKKATEKTKAKAGVDAKAKPASKPNAKPATSSPVAQASLDEQPDDAVDRPSDATVSADVPATPSVPTPTVAASISVTDLFGLDGASTT